MAFEYHSVRGHAFLLLWFFVYGLAPLAECELIEGRILRPLSWGRSNSMSKDKMHHWELSESSWVVLKACSVWGGKREVRWASHRSSCQLSREVGCRVPVKGFSAGDVEARFVSGLMALNHFPHTEMKSKIRIPTTSLLSLVPQFAHPVLDFQWCPS